MLELFLDDKGDVIALRNILNSKNVPLRRTLTVNKFQLSDKEAAFVIPQLVSSQIAFTLQYK